MTARKPTALYRQTPLTVAQVLAWAEDHRARTGAWPKAKDGIVGDTLDEDWFSINQYLRLGLRGLPGGGSLAKLLRDRRGARNPCVAPPLSEDQILAWADAHRRRTGAWPTQGSGPVYNAPGEVWLNVQVALREGRRGLPGGDSLARLLRRRFGASNRTKPPPLSEAVILHWADAYHAREGRWPTVLSGPVAESPKEKWVKVDAALRGGYRGLPGGSSLAQLLERERGARNHYALPPLTEELILGWAEDHFRQTGRWPARSAGLVAAAPGENWDAVSQALRVGCRGLPGGDSVRQLLARRQGGHREGGKPPKRAVSRP